MHRNRILICASTSLDSGEPALPTASASPKEKLSNMRRNILNALQTTDEQVVFHRCKDFDVMSEIRGKKKKQPDSNRQVDFEVYNEVQLDHISANIVVISDK